MQLNPARGRKLVIWIERSHQFSNQGLCSSTPRGDGNFLEPTQAYLPSPRWFMQLNPARGRKLSWASSITKRIDPWFMQLNPARGRKLYVLGLYREPSLRFMQLNPARGQKLFQKTQSDLTAKVAVYAAQPREGTETIRLIASSSTADAVYAAQPREGTETKVTSVCIRKRIKPRFMQLNPARGRKRGQQA